MADACSTDSSICCYTDDSSAAVLMIACVALATALLVTLIAFAWVCVCMKVMSGRSRKVGRWTKNREKVQEQGRYHTGLMSSASNSAASTLRKKIDGEPTGSGSPDDVEKGNQTARKRTEYNHSVLGLESANKAGQGVNVARSQSMRDVDNVQGHSPQMRVRSNSCGIILPPSPGSSVGPDTVHRLRVLLDTERSRRMAAESVIGRCARSPESLSNPGLRTSLRRFPDVGAIEAHALEATANAARWAQSTIAHARPGEPDLPNLIVGMLAHAFWTCRAEVARRLESRVQGLQLFVGGDETVMLGAKIGVMAGDTQELMYSELRRRYQSIALASRQKVVSLSAGIVTRALDTEERRDLGRKLVNQTWPTFEPLVKSYLALFVECALQRPAVEFEDTVGKEEPFNTSKHRELAGFVETEGSTCSVVFPAIKASNPGRQAEYASGSDSLRSGVIVWSASKYFRL